MNSPTLDRRALAPNQIVQVRSDYSEKWGGLWVVIRELDPEYLTGVILMEGEDQTLIRLPRLGVETRTRVFLRTGDF